MPEWMSVKPNQVMLILYSDQVIQSGVCRCKFAAWYVLIANIPEIIFFINVFLCLNLVGFGFSFMLFNATFNNISVNRAGQVYWGMKPEDLEKNHRPVACHWQTLSLNVVHLALIEIRTHNISDERHWLHR